MSLIKLDIDTKWNCWVDFVNRFRVVTFVLKENGIHVRVVHVASTRGGYHIELETDTELSYLECSALQPILGDDPARATFNFLRARNGSSPQNANVLFARKYSGAGEILSSENQTQRKLRALRALLSKIYGG